MKNQFKVKAFKLAGMLIGCQLPTNQGGHAGRAVEDLLRNMGVDINTGKGADILVYGLELKTRKLSATSSQTVATISETDLVVTPYRLSPIYAKFQQQLRVYTNDLDIIVDAKVVDFDQPQIQDLVETAYEHGRKQIIASPGITHTSYAGGYWGYFEQCHLPRSTAYSFRFSGTDLEKLVDIAESTFSTLFDYEIA
jgi:hypothetical protein